MAEFERWWTPAQVADRLQISAELCYHLIACGELRSARVGARRLRISESALVDFMTKSEARSADR